MTGEKPGSFRWFLVFWLFILSAVAFLDRSEIWLDGIIPGRSSPVRNRISSLADRRSAPQPSYHRRQLGSLRI